MPPCAVSIFVLQQQHNLGRRFGTSKMHLIPKWLRLLSVLSGSVVVYSLLILTPIVGFCNCSMFCCALLLCNHLDREERAGCFAKLVFPVSRHCCVVVPWICLEFVIVFPDYTH